MTDSFSEIIKGERPTLVDFFATWCGPCKAMKPVLDDLKSRVGEKVRILTVDVDRNPAIAMNLQVMGVPTLILFKNGNAIWRQSGVVLADQLERVINQHTI